jgi:hypothetical protein
VAANIAAFNARIAEWFTQPPASFRCSATAKHGRHELLAVIDELLVAIQAESGPIATDAETAEEISPAPKKKLKQLPKRRPDIDAARPW